MSSIQVCAWPQHVALSRQNGKGVHCMQHPYGKELHPVPIAEALVEVAIAWQ